MMVLRVRASHSLQLIYQQVKEGRLTFSLKQTCILR